MDDVVELEPVLQSKLVPLYQEFRDASKPVRDLRHKVIAHLDLPTATKTAASPPPATVKEVQAALDALANFMNSVQTHFGEVPTAYGNFGMMGAGPKELVAMLRTADRYAELQKAGEIAWDDPVSESE